MADHTKVVSLDPANRCRSSRDTFVGRDDELSRLSARLQECAAGEGRAVMIAGEPGIGKTRLVEELVARAG